MASTLGPECSANADPLPSEEPVIDSHARPKAGMAVEREVQASFVTLQIK
jgi:hypothetical protein